MSPLAAITVTLLLVATTFSLVRRARRGRPALVRARLEQLAGETGATPTTHGLRLVRSGRSFDAGLLWAKGHRHAALEIWTGDSDGTPAPAATEGYRDGPAPPPPAVLGRPAIAMHFETWRDRLGKLLRINREVQTGDGAFDRRVYLESDATDDEVRAVLADGRARAGILRLLELGFSLVRINGHADATLAAVQLQPDVDRLNAELVEATALRLGEAVSGLPAFGLEPAAQPAGPEASSIVTALSVAAAITCIPAYYLVASQYPLLDGRDLRHVIAGALCLWVLAMVGIARLVRGRSTSLRALGTSFVMLLVGLPGWAATAAVATNGGIDTSTATDRTTQVERNWTESGSHGGMSYYLEFPPIRPGARSVDVSVDKAFYASHPVGAPVVLSTRAGAFGWEWRQGIYAAR